MKNLNHPHMLHQSLSFHIWSKLSKRIVWELRSYFDGFFLVGANPHRPQIFQRAFELRGYQAIIWLTQFVFRALFVYTTDGVNKVLSIIYTLIGLICLLYLSSEQLLLYILCWHNGIKICLNLHQNFIICVVKSRVTTDWGSLHFEIFGSKM